MARLAVFNSVTLDGYFTDRNGDMSDGILLFGRVTYEMMAGFWPTPAAKQMMPAVAEGMNRMRKVVVSKAMDKASWGNSTIIKDLVPGVRKLKAESDKDIVILGSGKIVAQLTQARLIDEYQMVVVPVVLGGGRTMFEGVRDKVALKETKTRNFKNGNVLRCYEPQA